MISKRDCLNILQSDGNWWEYYAQAILVKKNRSGNRIRLNTLLNAKSGLCAEDCGYCSQAKGSKSNIERYGLLPKNQIIRQAIIAKRNNSSVFCIALSGTRPTDKEISILCDVISEIKSIMTIEICLSIGLVRDDQLVKLKAAGVDRINHNLNTPRDNYPKITTTHTYQDRLDTLEVLRRNNINTCSGFICGMGETDEQLIELAFDLKSQEPYSVPVNFLLPIKGTKLEGRNELTPMRCLKILVMLRLLFPDTELRISAGREYHLGEMQQLAILIVDSIFLGNYLTEKGAKISEDQKLIQGLGLTVEGECNG
ncbi:biotin synthase BioB [Streptococcus gallolyticus]|uniref:biotin synthase BioB n=1 Tax=Streptococcus gallolyticus TaxID=315405 RepID=UPI002283D497|nr:biotin synthase BioB [Streptococcus gallolyticus]MCY7191961.1 biotin synthase BioB [Streptococcus gallolyticus subsp. gallolyticus]